MRFSPGILVIVLILSFAVPIALYFVNESKTTEKAANSSFNQRTVSVVLNQSAHP